MPKLIMQLQQSDSKKGAFATMFSVIILMILSVTVVSSILIANIDSLKMSKTTSDSVVARALAQTCGEIAINNLKLNPDTYIGGETVVLAQGSCQVVSITGTGLSNRTIRTTGTVGTVIKKNEIALTTVNPTTEVSSWREVDF